MDSTELYMMLIRPSLIPIIGEAWTIPFNLQVELGSWNWKITNAEELRKASKFDTKFSARKDELKKNDDERRAGDLKKQLASLQDGFEFEDLTKSISEAKKEKDPAKLALKLEALGGDVENMQQFLERKAAKLSQSVTDKTDKDRVAKEREQKTQGINEQIADATAENFKFKFSKRVDFASTQMLNSMKQGDLFPTGIITLFQRAPNLNHAASLIITVTKFRLLDYKLRCEVTDTMTDMREDWEAEFYSLGYVYKGRGMIKKESGAALVTAALTQGTPRVFAMSMKGTLPI